MKAMKDTEGYGALKNTIVCVAELWREAPKTGQVNEPMKLKNAFMQTKEELMGPLMTNIVALADYDM